MVAQEADLASGSVVLPAFISDRNWYMSFGERAAVVGILAALRPRIAIEIGSADGGSLRPAARYSDVVHSFDLRLPPATAMSELGNVVFHTGDCHRLLPKVLQEVKAAGETVSYAMVDGDHSAAGVRRDVTVLLESGVLRGVILVHDVTNPRVRQGVTGIPFEQYPDVTYVDREFVSGRFMGPGEEYNELWGGLALIAVGAERSSLDPEEAGTSGVYPERYRELGPLLAEVRQVLLLGRHLRYGLIHPIDAVALMRQKVVAARQRRGAAILQHR